MRRLVLITAFWLKYTHAEVWAFRIKSSASHRTQVQTTHQLLQPLLVLLSLSSLWATVTVSLLVPEAHQALFAPQSLCGQGSPLSLSWLGPSQASGLSFRATFAKRAFLSTQLERGHFLFSFSAPYYFTALVLIGIYFITTPSSLIRLLSSMKAFPRLFLFYI